MNARPQKRRAFALLLAVMLAAAGSLVVVVMIERMTAERRAVKRLVESYHVRHDILGAQEILVGWFQRLQADKLADVVGPDGHALDIVLGDGRIFEVYLSDGQGTILSDPSLLAPEERADADAVIQKLREIVAPERIRKLTRPAGPLAISLASADLDVLRAVAETVAPPRQAEILLRELLAVQRAREGPTMTALQEAAARADIQGQERIRLFNLLSLQPAVWAYRIDVLPYARWQGTIRSVEGLVKVPRAAARGSTTNPDVAMPMQMFLSAEPVRYDTPTPDHAAPLTPPGRRRP